MTTTRETMKQEALKAILEQQLDDARQMFRECNETVVDLRARKAPKEEIDQAWAAADAYVDFIALLDDKLHTLTEA